MDSSVFGRLTEQNASSDEVIRSLITLFQNVEAYQKPFKEVFESFLEDNVVRLSQKEQDLLLARLEQGACHFRRVPYSSKTAREHDLARVLDTIRYAIYRRLQERPALPGYSSWFRCHAR